jgi:hypothetical protein
VLNALGRLVLLCFVIAGCGGRQPEPPLGDLLPTTLAGVRLTKDAFTGPAWLRTRPEFSSPYFVPEARADVGTFLGRLEKSPEDLTVAWATAPEGIQVIAYRVRRTKAARLIDAYVDAASAAERARRINVAGRSVTLIRGTSQRGFLYAHGDVLYAANSYHVDGSELEELIAKLPGDRLAEPPIAQLLPAELGGVRLDRETFRGSVWVRAAPEETFQPEVDVELMRFLKFLDEPPSALIVAWATAPEGPKVVAYRVTGIRGDALLSSFVQAVRGVRTMRRHIAGKQVAVAASGVPGRLGYLYANGDTLFVAGTNHLGAGEVEELLSKLP